jgi:hypothetical protein
MLVAAEEETVGAVDAALTVPVTTKSFPVWKLFKYQVPVPLEPVRVTLKVTVVVAGKFCKSATPERMMAT